MSTVLFKALNCDFVGVESRLVAGVPSEQIIRHARRWGAVMGTHGRSGFGRPFLGSMAELVLRGATCPVLTVRGR